MIVIVACFLSQMSHASDAAREAIYEAALQRVNVGKLTLLEAGGQTFPSLYTEADAGEVKGAVLILHDLGGFPDQQPLISLLRTEFPSRHFASLALQMPLHEFGASSDDYYELFPEAIARIQAGIAFLVQKKIQPIIIIGYGLGGLMALFADSEKQLDIKALVTLSLPVPVSEQKAAQTLEMLKKVKHPLFDVYAEHDLPEVKNTARDRRLAAQANPGYRQMQIASEDHLFRQQTLLVVKRIYSWVSSRTQ